MPHAGICPGGRPQGRSLPGLPGRAVSARAPGKGPDFGHAGDAGKREGMAGTARSIGKLNRFLRGWGNCHRTGNAATKFVTLDRYVWWRLLRLMVKKRGRNLHAGQADRWTSAWFHDQGLYKLMGTIRYPKAA
jgi:hypothetical protein